MSVDLEGQTIYLRDLCRVEDAEPLLTLLQADPARRVDVTEADHLHAAVVQVLLAFRPAITGPARDPFLERWIRPILGGSPVGCTNAA